VKKIIFGILAVVLIPSFLWWQQYKEDKEFMESLLLHQPIELNQIHSAKVWKANENGTQVSEADLKKIIEWFNDYPPNRITEQSDFDYSASNSGVKAGIYIELNSGYKIKIFFVNGDSIYVIRTDVKGGMLISYSLLEDVPELEDYFEELLKESDDIELESAVNVVQKYFSYISKWDYKSAWECCIHPMIEGSSYANQFKNSFFAQQEQLSRPKLTNATAKTIMEAYKFFSVQIGRANVVVVEIEFDNGEKRFVHLSKDEGNWKLFWDIDNKRIE
jgi:hypothetical protein